MGNKSLQELETNVLAENARVAEYRKVLQEYKRLQAMGGSQQEGELVRQSLTKMYGDAAQARAQEMGAASEKMRVAVVGELVEAAQKTLERNGLKMPGAAAHPSGAAWEFREMRDQMRHPDSGKRSMSRDDYKSMATKASGEVYKSLETLTKWVGGADGKPARQLTREQRAAVNKARAQLAKAYEHLDGIKSQKASSGELTAADIENAMNAHIVQVSGWAHEHIEASRKCGMPVNIQMKRLDELGRDVIHSYSDIAEAAAPVMMKARREPQIKQKGFIVINDARFGGDFTQAQEESQQKAFLRGALSGAGKGAVLGGIAWGAAALLNPSIGGAVLALLSGLGAVAMALHDGRRAQEKEMVLHGSLPVSRVTQASEMAPALAQAQDVAPEILQDQQVRQTRHVERYQAECNQSNTGQILR